MSYARSAVTRMTLDMSRLDLQRSETVTQGDTNRRWEVTLTNGGAPFRLPPNWTAALTGIKPDGTGLLNGCSVADGKIVYDFAAGAEIATCVGSYPVQFDIWDEVGELVASPKVYVNVLADVRPRAELESNGQYTIIGDLIGRVNQTDADVDLLGETALAQGDDIAALKEKITTAGTVTIPASEWTDTLSKLAYPEQPVLAKGTVALLMPGNTDSQNAARKAKITVQSATYGGGKIVIQREDGDAPTGNITLDYIVIKVDNPEAPPKAALIGVDAYGENSGTASGVDESAVRAIITAMLGNVANERQYSAANPPPYPVTSVNGKKGVVNLNAEDVGARPSTWMPTAADVRADSEGTAAEEVKDHNKDSDSHTDIRVDITTIHAMLNTVIGTDTGKSMRAVAALVLAEIVGDASDSFDTLEEIAAWIEAHPNDVAAMVKRITDLETAMGGKVSKTDIINTLDSTALDKPLSAAMGKQLAAAISQVNETLAGKTNAQQVSDAITAALKDYLTTAKAAELYQPAGDYPTTADMDEAISAATKDLAPKSSIPTVPEKLPNPHALTINGKTYDGSSPVNVTVEGSEGVADTVDIYLNDEDIAIVGHEYNLYHYAIVHGKKPYTEYDIAVTLSYVDDNGKTVAVAANNYEECFRFTPTEARDYTLTYLVRELRCADPKNQYIAQKAITIHVIEDTAVSGKKVLFIGDSFTDAGYWPAEIQHNLSGGGITSIGTVSDTVTIGGQNLTVLHEGRQGWATWDYAGTSASMTSKFLSAENVFRNPETNKFDLSYYMTTYHPGVTLNAVCVFLGTNGLGAITSVINGMTELIARIREYDANVPILLHYTLQNVGQDYWSKFAEQKTSTKWYRQHLWREQYGEYKRLYSGMDNVYIVPVYQNLDYDLDFPKKDFTASARNTTVVSRVTDGHPSKDGYLKMADVYYAYLLKYMREGGEVEEPDEPVEPDEPDEPTDVNLVDPTTANDDNKDTTTPFKNEWVNGYYVGYSGGLKLSEKEGTITTNLIPVTYGQKLNIEGIKLSSVEDKNRFRWMAFKADGSTCYSSYLTPISTSGEGANSTTVNADATGGVVDTSLWDQSKFKDLAYVRFSCFPAGANEDVVVTLIE